PAVEPGFCLRRTGTRPLACRDPGHTAPPRPRRGGRPVRARTADETDRRADWRAPRRRHKYWHSRPHPARSRRIRFPALDRTRRPAQPHLASAHRTSPRRRPQPALVVVTEVGVNGTYAGGTADALSRHGRPPPTTRETSMT